MESIHNLNRPLLMGPMDPSTATLQTSPAQIKSFDFLALPKEVRTYIYELTIPTNTVQNIGRDKYKPHATRPALLATSVQVRLETVGLYYGTNIFDIRIELDKEECFERPLKEWLMPIVTGRFGRTFRFQDLRFHLFSNSGGKSDGP